MINLRRIDAIVRKIRYKLLLILMNTALNDLHKRGIGSWNARIVLIYEIDQMLKVRALRQQGRKAKLVVKI